MTQPLLTADQREQLLANGQARASDGTLDPLPVLRLFALDAHATWLLASLDPADGDTAYGLIDLGLGMPDLGTVKLSELVVIMKDGRRTRARTARLQKSYCPVRKNAGARYCEHLLIKG